MISVFCTRILPQEEQAKARQSGVHIACQPFIEIRPCNEKNSHPELLSALHHRDLTLLFTSKNAVHIAFTHYLQKIPEHIRSSWQYYCLSGATQTALTAYCSPGQILASAPHARALTELIDQPPLTEPLHFFSGHRRKDTLPDFLSRQGYRFKEWVVYQTTLTPQVVNVPYDGYLFYSPSAAESFFSVNSLPENCPCFAIGPSTAATLHQLFSGPVYESSYPDTDHLLTLIQHHLSPNR